MIDYSIIGKRFGRLTVLELDHVTRNRNTYWLCQCDCGNKKVIYRGALTSGDAISCGCYHQEHSHEFNLKHGLTSHPLYTVWAGMKNRCNNVHAANYYRYGGRGIEVCNEWNNDFKKFYDWAIENRYSKELTLDRINNNGNYEPDNCKWSNIRAQQNNTRRNHYFTYLGITHTIAEWARILNVNHETLRYRILHNNLKDFEKMRIENE